MGAPDRKPAYQRLARAAVGTAVVFAVSGAMLGTWASRLPTVRDQLHARPTALGLALLASGLGSLTSMPSTGWLCRRLGSRGAGALTALPGCASVFVLALASSVPALAAGLFVFGFLYGAWDVSMNVQGSTVDQRAGRAWMPRYHGCWSAGGIVGAGLGAVAAGARVPLPLHFGVAALAGAVLVIAGLRTYVEDRDAPAAKTDKSPVKRPAVLSRRLIVIGLIAICSVVPEVAAADWLAIYLVDTRHVPDWLGAVAYATFASAMTAGRFAGTPVMERLGRVRAVGIGGAVTVAGVLLAVLGPGLAVAYVGAALWALGVCLAYPAAISAAGETPTRPADAIAAVSTIGYSGSLLGPPLIGILADQVGLGRALLVLVLLAATMSACAPAIHDDQHSS